MRPGHDAGTGRHRLISSTWRRRASRTFFYNGILAFPAERLCPCPARDADPGLRRSLAPAAGADAECALLVSRDRRPVGAGAAGLLAVERAAAGGRPGRSDCSTDPGTCSLTQPVCGTEAPTAASPAQGPSADFIYAGSGPYDSSTARAAAHHAAIYFAKTAGALGRLVTGCRPGRRRLTDAPSSRGPVAAGGLRSAPMCMVMATTCAG